MWSLITNTVLNLDSKWLLNTSITELEFMYMYMCLSVSD